MLSTNLTNVRETGSVIDNAHFNVVRNASAAFHRAAWLSMARSCLQPPVISPVISPSQLLTAASLPVKTEWPRPPRS